MAEIYHVVTDRDDPAWDCWDVYNEEGDHWGSEPYLRIVRHIYDTTMHRGPYPGWSKEDFPIMIQNFVRERPGGAVEPVSSSVRIYWFERET